MTNQPELKPCRAAFEAWYDTTPSRAIERNGERYILMQTELSWCAWQAAWNTRAEPAAPSSEHIETALRVTRNNGQAAAEYFAIYNEYPADTLRAHIASLEEGIEALSSANESFAKRIANLATENKRLREALKGMLEVFVDDTGDFEDMHTVIAARSALAQTDGLKECRVCDGAGYHLIPTTGHGCCGSFLSSGECCGNAVQVDTGLEEQPCIACDGTGKESLAQTDGKAGE